MTKHPVIVTLTGPSGSGKTVLSSLLHAQGLEPLVSTTTRLPRQGEQHGKDYFFVTREQFAVALAEGKFIENVEYNGVLYGVSVAEAERAFSLSRPAVLVAEPHGVEQIKKFSESRGWSVLRVFVDNPEKVLLARLINRMLKDVGVPPYADTALDALDQDVAILSQHLEAGADDDTVKQLLETLVARYGVDPQEPTVAKHLHSNAHRLTSFQFEQNNWVKPARNGAQPYEFVTDSFNEHVQQSVVEAVLSDVQDLQSDPPRHKTRRP